MRNVLLLLLLVSVFSAVTVERLCAKSGQLVALQCPRSRQKPEVVWSTPRHRDIASANRTDLLVLDGELVLLRASEELQGKYSCSNGGHSATFDLSVYTDPSGDCVNVTHNQHCYAGRACTLDCPASNTPQNTAFSSRGVTWQQGGRTLSREEPYFSSVKVTDRGVFTCRRSYEFRGQVYDMTFTRELEVYQKGSPLVINCTGWISSGFDEIYWKIGESLFNSSNTARVFSSAPVVRGERMTVSLVFKAVTEEDLTSVFTCKLAALQQKSNSVNVTLAQKESLSYKAVTVTAVVIPAVMLIFVLIYIKYKVHITLFLRDTLGCHGNVSDGKRFDAFIMCYRSEQGPGLSADDTTTLQSVLEGHFGYSLCLFHRQVLPGNAVAEAVLECVEQSRVVVLVPASPDLSSEWALLSAVHEALVERQTRLVLIKTASTEKGRAEPLSETLQLLMDLGHCVTWPGSPAPSSFFWKQLRYHLPPVQESHTLSLLPQAVVL
ncbi:interleukin-18 receptor 1-like [Eucyclogobius newberryi]|uniref:interleukin-18 receptor 1-like n=1 Tax=Eucyclogobius newberryi TaxID=166745 RepID=UPI003B5BD2C0